MNHVSPYSVAQWQNIYSHAPSTQARTMSLLACRPFLVTVSFAVHYHWYELFVASSSSVLCQQLFITSLSPLLRAYFTAHFSCLLSTQQYRCRYQLPAFCRLYLQHRLLLTSHRLLAVCHSNLFHLLALSSSLFIHRTLPLDLFS